MRSALTSAATLQAPVLARLSASERALLDLASATFSTCAATAAAPTHHSANCTHHHGAAAAPRAAARQPLPDRRPITAAAGPRPTSLFSGSAPLLAKPPKQPKDAAGATNAKAGANTKAAGGDKRGGGAAATAFKAKPGRVPTPQFIKSVEEKEIEDERVARLENAQSYDPSKGQPILAQTVEATVYRMSRMFIPTAHEAPADATLRSHQLLVRAGYIKQLASGHYYFLPLAVRVLKKIETIVREEMDAVGGEELSMPIVMPRALWETTGRWDTSGAEMFRLRDRHDGEFCLGPTHEEPVTQLVQLAVDSYKQLPVRLYQIGRKFRDEARPRGGLLRCREFVMKDMYSFDADFEGAHETYKGMLEAYKRVFERAGVPAVQVEADSGNIGGSLSHEYHVLADAGEDTLYTCELCAYTANQEKTAFAINPAFDHNAHSQMLRAGRLTDSMKCDPRAVGLATTAAGAAAAAAASAVVAAAAAKAKAARRAADAAAEAAAAAPTKLGSTKVSVGDSTVSPSLAAMLPPIDDAAPTAAPSAAAAAASSAEAAAAAAAAEVAEAEAAAAAAAAAAGDQYAKLRAWVQKVAKRLVNPSVRTDVPYVMNVLRLTFKGDAAGEHGPESLMPDGPCKNMVLVAFRADRELNACAVRTFFEASDATVLSAEEAAAVLMTYYKHKVASHRAKKQAGQLQASHSDPLAREPTQFAQVSLMRMARYEESNDTAAMQAEMRRVARVNLSKLDDGGLAVMTDTSLVVMGHDVDFLGLDGYTEADLANVDTNRTAAKPSSIDSLAKGFLEHEKIFAKAKSNGFMDDDPVDEAEEKRMSMQEALARKRFSKLDMETDDEMLDEQALQAERAGGMDDNYGQAMMSLAPTQGDFVLPADGDRCIQQQCNAQGIMRPRRGIEVGHVFYLGTKYSEPLGAKFTDDGGRVKTMEMGCYGIGVSRLLSAAVEADGGADEHGLRWPEAIAPFNVYITAIGKAGEVPERVPGVPSPYEAHCAASAKVKAQIQRRQVALSSMSSLMRASHTQRSGKRGYMPLFTRNGAGKRLAGSGLGNHERAAEDEQASLRDMYNEVWNWGDVDNPTHAEKLAAALGAFAPYLDGDILLDDRHGLSPGARMRDATLVGIPWVIVVGRDMQATGRVEVQHRRSGVSQLMTIPECVAFFNGHQPVMERVDYDAAAERLRVEAEVEQFRLKRMGYDGPDFTMTITDTGDKLLQDIPFDYSRDRVRGLIDESITATEFIREDQMPEGETTDEHHAIARRHAHEDAMHARRPAIVKMMEYQREHVDHAAMKVMLDEVDEAERVAKLEGATQEQKDHARKLLESSDATMERLVPPNFVEVLDRMRGPSCPPLQSREIADMAEAGIIYDDAHGFVRVDMAKAKARMDLVRGDRYRGKSEEAISDMIADERRARKERVNKEQKVYERQQHAQATVQRKLAENARVPVRPSGLYHVAMPTTEEVMDYRMKTNRNMSHFAPENKSEQAPPKLVAGGMKGRVPLGKRSLKSFMPVISTPAADKDDADKK